MQNVKKKLKKYCVSPQAYVASLRIWSSNGFFYEGCNEYSFSIKKGNFVTVFATTSLLKVTVIHGVSYEHQIK
jgi:hypothetical protein